MRGARIVLVAIAIAFVASADTVQLPAQVVDALSSIDHATPVEDLDTLGSGSSAPAAAAASQIAQVAANPNVDVGVALRSIYALSQYPQSVIGSSLAHDTLAQLVAAYISSSRPTDVLLLRASIESLGPLRVSADADMLDCSPSSTLAGCPLDHPSRDVRTATARALRDIGNPSAIPLLRARLGAETVPQVKLAIAAALAALGGG